MMKKSCFTETQIVNILKLADSGMKFDEFVVKMRVVASLYTGFLVSPLVNIKIGSICSYGRFLGVSSI